MSALALDLPVTIDFALLAALPTPAAALFAAEPTFDAALLAPDSIFSVVDGLSLPDCAFAHGIASASAPAAIAAADTNRRFLIRLLIVNLSSGFAAGRWRLDTRGKRPGAQPRPIYETPREDGYSIGALAKADLTRQCSLNTSMRAVDRRARRRCQTSDRAMLLRLKSPWSIDYG